MAWATTASEDDLPAPADHDQNPVSNYVVETASGNVIMQIPNGHYWETDHQPNHYDFEPAWSPDYTHLIVVYNGRWSFDLVVIADLKQVRVWNVGDKLAADFRRHLRATAGPAYLRTQGKLARTYQTLRALLPAEERQKLVAEQRAWLRQRDAIMDARRQVAFVSDRQQELEALLEKVVAEKSR
jgi:hypothetical protein